MACAATWRSRRSAQGALAQCLALGREIAGTPRVRWRSPRLQARPELAAGWGRSPNLRSVRAHLDHGGSAGRPRLRALIGSAVCRRNCCSTGVGWRVRGTGVNQSMPRACRAQLVLKPCIADLCELHGHAGAGRVRTLVENGVKTNTRSLFVIVGDRGRDQAAPHPTRVASRWRSSVESRSKPLVRGAGSESTSFLSCSYTCSALVLSPPAGLSRRFSGGARAALWRSSGA